MRRDILSILSLLSTMIGIFCSLFGIFQWTNNLALLITVIIGFTLISMYLTTRVHKFEKRNGVSENLNELHSSIHYISGDEELEKQLIEVCDQIRLVFRGLIGKRCYVSIKTAYKSEFDTIYPTIAREHYSIYDAPQARERLCGKNWQVENSDVELIYSCFDKISDESSNEEIKKLINDSLFLMNRLNLKKEKTTFKHPVLFHEGNSQFLFMKQLFFPIWYHRRTKCWPLRYRSQLTFPIVPFNPDDIVRSKDIIGFISINCEKSSFVFDKNRDSSIIRGISDSLYHKILDVEPQIQAFAKNRAERILGKTEKK